jgi:hypothetical protein
MTRLHPDDIDAIVNGLAERVVFLMACPAPPQPVNEIERIQRRASELARAGFKDESIKLIKSLSKRSQRHAA